MFLLFYKDPCALGTLCIGIRQNWLSPITVKDVDDIVSWNKADPGFLLAAGQRVKEGPGLAAEKHPSGIILIQR